MNTITKINAIVSIISIWLAGTIELKIQRVESFPSYWLLIEGLLLGVALTTGIYTSFCECVMRYTDNNGDDCK